ncbi:MAG: hypothetical protein EOQ49_19390 [Mesorhizobium sp.]|nr:MAG: hypothetical protein EOQ49_19390 [Mesorhizobium sp.]
MQMAVAGERSRRSRFPVRHASSSRRGVGRLQGAEGTSWLACRYLASMVSLAQKHGAATGVRVRRRRSWTPR